MTRLDLQSEKRLQSEYDGLLERAKRTGADSDLLAQVGAWQEGKWRNYLDQFISRVPMDLKGARVLDFGCRYALLAPLLVELGIAEFIGIEDLEQYIRGARGLFPGSESRVKLLRSEFGYIPLQPESVDVVLMNEVISHVQPANLPVVYSEAARILVAGGLLFISDGNNLGYPPLLEEHLIPLYEALEKGPDGTQIGDVVVQSCFVHQRTRIILSRHPSISAEHVAYLAENTSGLHGAYLNQVIDRFAESGELIRRPYRRGTPPVYPDWGQVEERGFYPEQVVCELRPHGFDCRILDRPCRAPSDGVRAALPLRDIREATGYAGHAFQCPFPRSYPGDLAALLLEDGRALPHPTDNHAEIAAQGSGRYSLWRPNQTIYFSASDNSDPRRSKRAYELFWTADADDHVSYPSPNFQILATKTS